MMKETIMFFPIPDPYYGVKCHCNCKFLSEDTMAMTFFGRFLFSMKRTDFEHYVTTKSGKVLIHHEYIHILQARSFKTRYLGFYIYYFYYYLKNHFVKRYDWDTSYYEIPFEREAYRNESNFEYAKTEWRRYIDA